MENPRHWRLRAQRLRMEAAACPRCGEISFPPRQACPQCQVVFGCAGLDATKWYQPACALPALSLSVTLNDALDIELQKG